MKRNFPVISPLSNRSTPHSNRAASLRNLIAATLIIALLYGCGPVPTSIPTSLPPTEVPPSPTQPEPTLTATSAPTATATLMPADGLPADADTTCTTDTGNTAGTFATWFDNQKVEINGRVKPANSITFAHDSNCDFYQWSEQMFLWMTSPSPHIADQPIFNSTVFYDVTPVINVQGQRKLVPHTAGQQLLNLTVRDQQADENNQLITSQGQAGGNGVLETQNGSLVYYVTMVNDVYAYFLSGIAAKSAPKIVPTGTAEFPTTQDDLNQILAFATQANKTFKGFPDPNALAMEIKTSWVEVNDKLPNADSYIQMPALLPIYDTTNPEQWVLTAKTRPARLALVGFHVVGSAAGHPEMIWSTFEHKDNAPLDAYKYIDTNQQTKQVTQNTDGQWLFSKNKAAGPFNTELMKIPATPANTQFPPSIASVSTGTPIAPSDTMRIMAWGASSDISPNPEDASSAASNTEIISINNSVMGQLASGDVRANYIFVGSTWTFGGVPPTGPNNGTPPPPGPTPTGTITPGTPGNEVGTSLLANSSMETYHQGKDNTFSSYNPDGSGFRNCFFCHSGSGLMVIHNNPQAGQINHIFGDLISLFTP